MFHKINTIIDCVLSINYKIPNQIKIDVKKMTDIWKNVLIKNYSDNLRIIYVKGSSNKTWVTPIDYVPVLSDVDIHYGLKEDVNTINDSIEKAIRLSEEVHRQFREENPNYLHIPRMQIMKINQFENNLEFIPAKKEHCSIIYGDWVEKSFPSNEFITKIDLKRFMEDYYEILKIPEKLFDKGLIDYWTIIRTCSWRVSPTPYRLLTQLNLGEDLLEIWNWNRTKIVKKLLKNGYGELSELYSSYYLTGWENFKSKFTDANILTEQILLAYKIIIKAHEIIKKL